MTMCRRRMSSAGSAPPPRAPSAARPTSTMAPKLAKQATAQELGATQLSGLRWAEGLIADKAARRAFASAEFRADDADNGGSLDRAEVVVCITRICKKFGLALPREEKIFELLDLCDKVCCFHGCRGAHHVVLFLRQRFPPTGRTMTAIFRSRSFVRQRQLKLWTPKPSRSCMPLRALLSSPLPSPRPLDTSGRSHLALPLKKLSTSHSLHSCTIGYCPPHPYICPCAF